MKILVIGLIMMSSIFANCFAEVSQRDFDKLKAIVLKNQKRIEKLMPVGDTIDLMRRYFDKQGIEFKIEDDLSESELAQAFKIIKKCIYEVKKSHPEKELLLSQLRFNVTDRSLDSSGKRSYFWYMENTSRLSINRARITKEFPSVTACKNKLVSEALTEKD